MDETITLPGSDSERRYLVTSCSHPYTTLVEGEAVKSVYSIVVEDAEQ
jgi:hypothetical protein